MRPFRFDGAGGGTNHRIRRPLPSLLNRPSHALCFRPPCPTFISDYAALSSTLVAPIRTSPQLKKHHPTSHTPGAPRSRNKYKLSETN